MKLRIYVEDSYFQAYEALVKKWYETAVGRCTVDEVRAVHVRPTEMCEKMPEFVDRAITDGYRCILFVLDQESPHERTELIEDANNAFDRLCGKLHRDRTLRDVKVALVITKSCLECWLLTDTGAVKRATPRGRNVDYTPNQPGNTQMLDPRQARDEIAHIRCETARRASRGRGRRTRPMRYEKSAALDIANEMSDLSAASGRNSSLAHFLQMVTCTRNGCEHRQPADES